MEIYSRRMLFSEEPYEIIFGGIQALYVYTDRLFYGARVSFYFVYHRICNMTNPFSEIGKVCVCMTYIKCLYPVSEYTPGSGVAPKKLIYIFSVCKRSSHAIGKLEGAKLKSIMKIV